MDGLLDWWTRRAPARWPNGWDIDDGQRWMGCIFSWAWQACILSSFVPSIFSHWNRDLRAYCANNKRKVHAGILFAFPSATPPPNISSSTRFELREDLSMANTACQTRIRWVFHLWAFFIFLFFCPQMFAISKKESSSLLFWISVLQL